MAEEITLLRKALRWFNAHQATRSQHDARMFVTDPFEGGSELVEPPEELRDAIARALDEEGPPPADLVK